MTGEDTTQILQKVCLMQTQRGLVCRTDSLHLQLLTAMQSLWVLTKDVQLARSFKAILSVQNKLRFLRRTNMGELWLQKLHCHAMASCLVLVTKMQYSCPLSSQGSHALWLCSFCYSKPPRCHESVWWQTTEPLTAGLSQKIGVGSRVNTQNHRRSLSFLRLCFTQKISFSVENLKYAR